jgi:hypothetical protein
MFKPGNCANPRGRGKGSRGKYPRSIWQKLAQQGGRDPIEVLSEFVSSTTVDPNLKLQAAGMLASYHRAGRWLADSARFRKRADAAPGPADHRGEA